jgi:uncharacterized protein YjiS (DUF1127 family)
MSATFSTAVWPAVTWSARGVARIFNASLHQIARYFVRRAAIKTLSELDDRALRDIGLVRSHIEAAVHGFIIASDPSTDEMTTPAVSCTTRPTSSMEVVSWS